MLKLYRAVSQKEAEEFDTKSLIDFLIIEFEKWGLTLDSYYITGPYPNTGWKSTKGFLNGLKKKNYNNIHHLMISDSESKLHLDFQNWSHNRTVEVESDSIVFELMIDENLVSENDLMKFCEGLYPFMNFESGNMFLQSKKLSISEGKIKNGLFSYSESENSEYRKWSKYDSSVKYGYARNIYKSNFLSNNHLEKEDLKRAIDKHGQLDKNVGFFMWSEPVNEIELVRDFLKTSEVLVENKEFDNTTICKLIDKEIRKYAPQQQI